MISEILSVEPFLWSCLWQSTIFLIAGLLGSFFLRHHSARAHRVLFLAMIAAVVVPATSILVKHYELGIFTVEPAVIQPPIENHAVHKATGIISNEAIKPALAQINQDLPSPMTASGVAKFPWRSALFCAWIAASLILATRLFVTFTLGIRLLHQALPFDNNKIKQALDQAKTKLDINKQVQIYSCRCVRSPVIWCWGRKPALLIPSAIDKSEGVDWVGVLCHELAHHKRRDYVFGLLAEFTVCILPWHPLLWLAKSRLISLSEQACDDWVIASGQSGTDYAESLLNLIPEGKMAFMPAVVSSKKGLVGRIHRILKDRCGNPRTGAAWALAACIVATCFAIGVAFAQNRPADKETAKDKQAEFGQERIICFPKDQSMGMLYVLDWDKLDTSSYSEWEPLCEATGNVTIPTGKALRLELNKDAGDDLSSLSALKPNDLQILMCHRVEILDDELIHLSGLTGLQELHLSSTEILGTGLKYLTKLKLLRELNIGNTHVGDKELAYLANLPSPDHLNLFATPTSDAGMEHVGKIKSLTTLSLSRGVGDEGLEHLADLTQMKDMSLFYTQVSDEGLVHLKQMSQLKKLNLFGTRVTDKGFVHVKGLKNLESLGFNFYVSDIGLEYLSQLDFLKSLKIDGDSVTDKGLAKLAKMKSLEGLSVGGEENHDEIIGKLADLPGLKNLELTFGLTDKGFARLKDIKSLQSLELYESNITGKAMMALTELPFLRELSIREMNLSDEEHWISLGKLVSLESLDLRSTPSRITDANISHLSNMHSLKVLKISSVLADKRNVVDDMDVTDEGLMHLSKLQALEHLSLTGAKKITDEGLQQLSKIKGLKRLDLQACGG
ncbi:M56 family metallopeptidase, partial [Planctomycetota bacterium]